MQPPWLLAWLELESIVTALQVTKSEFNPEGIYRNQEGGMASATGSHLKHMICKTAGKDERWEGEKIPALCCIFHSAAAFAHTALAAVPAGWEQRENREYSHCHPPLLPALLPSS